VTVILNVIMVLYQMFVTFVSLYVANGARMQDRDIVAIED